MTPAVATAGSAAADVLGATTDVSLSCADAICRGTVTLYDGKVAVGEYPYALHAGKAITVRVGLDKTGLEDLAKAKGHVLWVREVVAIDGGKTVERAIRLSPAPVVTAPTGRPLVEAHGRFVTSLSCADAICRGTVTLYAGKTAVGAETYALHAGKVVTVGVALDKTGLEALAKAKGHVLWVHEVITLDGGQIIVRGVQLSPAPVVAVPTSRVAKVVSRGVVQSVVCAGAVCRGTVRLYHGEVTVAVPKGYAIGAGKTATITVLLDKAGLGLLARAKGHVLWVHEVITLDGGQSIVRGIQLAG